MTTRKVEYRVRCLSGPGREDAYESPIPIPLVRFGQVASVKLQGLKNAFTVSFRKGPRVDPEGIQESGKAGSSLISQRVMCAWFPCIRQVYG